MVDYDWDVDTAYASLLTQMYKMGDATTGYDSRDSQTQKDWAEGLRAFYNVCSSSEDKQKENPSTWCPVLQDWIPKDRCKAAHIVPYSIGYVNAGYMFGQPEAGEDVLWDKRNGLWMHGKVEEALDNG